MHLEPCWRFQVYFLQRKCFQKIIWLDIQNGRIDAAENTCHNSTTFLSKNSLINISRSTLCRYITLRSTYMKITHERRWVVFYLLVNSTLAQNVAECAQTRTYALTKHKKFNWWCIYFLFSIRIHHLYLYSLLLFMLTYLHLISFHISFHSVLFYSFLYRLCAIDRSLFCCRHPLRRHRRICCRRFGRCRCQVLA